MVASIEKLRRSWRKSPRHWLRSMQHGLLRAVAPLRNELRWQCLLAQRMQSETRRARCAVTLTSYPARYPTLAATIKSLLAQRLRPAEVVLSLYAGDVAALPHQVLALQAHGLRLMVSEDNLKVYLKLIPALRSASDVVWVTADDDIYYPPDWLETLWGAHEAKPDAIVCRRAHVLRWGEDGYLLPYRVWPKRTALGAASDPLFLTGVGGVLYPPGSLHPEVTRSDLFLALSPNADDIWLNAMARRIGTPILRVGPVDEPITWMRSQREGLFRLNARGHNNDECLARMAAHFGPDFLRPQAQGKSLAD
ncbi:glycosyltransferase family 2 protein [Piscinibacter sp. Jin2]|uniref:Glycosyltransferase family 2 protein n=1 Tax=Aquariibacter lacus TaxID=2801332 RepID=A0A9X1BR42_9BURK|nr:glycosyltransferase family A protein [Piscinibacter lacus]MBL0719539.1 glycosyltransferase family 2 protein [Piscinibacter lacus]